MNTTAKSGNHVKEEGFYFLSAVTSVSWSNEHEDWLIGKEHPLGEVFLGKKMDVLIQLANILQSSSEELTLVPLQMGLSDYYLSLENGCPAYRLEKVSSPLIRCQLNEKQESDLAKLSVEYRSLDGDIWRPGLFFIVGTDRYVGAPVFAVSSGLEVSNYRGGCRVLDWKTTLSRIESGLRKTSVGKR